MRSKCKCTEKYHEEIHVKKDISKFGLDLDAAVVALTEMSLPSTIVREHKLCIIIFIMKRPPYFPLIL